MASSEFSIARSTLLSSFVSLFLESLFFGVFTIVYGITTWILLFRERPQRRLRNDFLLFSASTVMYILSLSHIAIDLHINLRGFFLESHDFPAMAHVLDTYNGLVDPIGAVKFAIYVTQTLIGDGFMIYRAYVVWNRRWIVAVVPAVLLLAEVVLGYVTSCLGRFGGNVSRTTDCVNAFFILSVATNLTSSGIIMKRILSQSRNTTQSRQPTRGPARPQPKTMRWRVVESLVQSAAVYSIASISLAITSFLSPAIGFPACHSAFPSIIGIAFVLIVIRISLNTGPGADTPRQMPRQSVAAGLSRTSLNTPGAAAQTAAAEAPLRPQRLTILPGRPIAIQVSVSTTSDVASAVSSHRTSVYTIDTDNESYGGGKEREDEKKSERASVDYSEEALDSVLHISGPINDSLV
ncbi:hypothetical protein BC628DRAFT_958769 [Trametes gibbosa]|nr:hypothetical protein BC628DRAFT_958769 [Trametes gibbosa]